MEEEATEDMLRLVGAGAEERLSSAWHYSFRTRLPWLLVSLALAGLAALVVQLFEDTIAAWAVLAAYMPVVAGIGGNASAQATAVAIRGIATGEAGRVALRRVITRELRVGAAGGLLIGVLAGGIAVGSGADRAVLLGGIVAVSLFINQSVACVWGACMPFLMMRLVFDPAQSATIFTTTLTDVVGLLTLLGLATAAAMLFAT
jgi:magnesium transporter